MLDVLCQGLDSRGLVGLSYKALQPAPASEQQAGKKPAPAAQVDGGGSGPRPKSVKQAGGASS